ncbi:MAG: hypothetical protein HYT71_01355 [Candidatus Aenigmarchaeota archaeon]|nr:hypothetical protein [Candidatus Aenigmarchaeota archaeon]
MATFDFIGLQNTLRSMGFYDFVLPWLLAFSIVFGILQTVMIFKKGADNTKSNTSVDAVIALAVAFYLTIFTPYSGFLSSFFSKLFGSSIIVLSGILMLLMFVGIFGFNSQELFGGTKSKAAITIVALILAGLFLINASSGVFSFGNGQLVNGETLTVIAFFGMIAAIIWFVVNDGKTKEKDEDDKTTKIDPKTGKPI